MHGLTCGVLIGIFTLETVKTATPWSAGILVSLGIATGLLGLVAIMRLPRVHEGLRYLAIAPPLFAVFMLGFTPVADIAFADEPGPVDIRVGEPGRLVVLILDEFPLMSLLDGHGRVDAGAVPELRRIGRYFELVSQHDDDLAAHFSGSHHDFGWDEPHGLPGPPPGSTPQLFALFGRNYT